MFFLVPMVVAAAPYDPRPDLDAGRYLKALAEADGRLQGNPRDALALAARSQALTAMMKLPEAMEAANKALEVQPGLAEGLLARGMARGGSAIQQRNLGSLRGIADAMDDLRAAVQAEPGLVAAHMALGLAYQQLPGILGGSTRKALAEAETVKRLDAARGFSLQGTILAMDGRWEEARGAFGAAFAKAPRSPDVIYAYLEALGSREVRKAIGDEEQNRQLAAEASRLLPLARGNARALCAVCNAFIDAGKGEEAWGSAKGALPESDAPSLLRLELGKISARNGVHREEGLAFLKQVLREPLEGGSGGYATVHWRMGQILQAQGRKEEARAQARAALSIDPKDAKATRLLKDLQP